MVYIGAKTTIMSNTQEGKLKRPMFLSNKPTGEDKFEGGSQEKTANVIVELIKSDYYKTKVIGLDGSWGAGKSNVVEIIKAKLSNDYITFIFDAWGNQEDLTRKSFLEQLINELLTAKCITNIEKLNSIKNELLAKKTTRNKETFPTLKAYWLFITSAILLFGFLLSVYENILEKNDFIQSVYFGIWKPIIGIYLFPILLFSCGICLMVREYKKLKKKEEFSKKSFWDIIGIILYWFKGKEIESIENERTMEDEPSVYKFKEYFKAIEKEISGKKNLLIVFDNLDRLEKEKIKSLWSSIHTFFSDSKEDIDSWVIIPYNKEELLKHLSDYSEQEIGSGFIEKSIPINFRVTPPIVREWEKFFDIKLDEAFNVIKIDVEEKNILRKIFDHLINSNTIKPRQIIRYINDITTLYLQWENEVNAGTIKFRHLGVFAMTKDKITEDPINQILSREYLTKAKSLFDFDKKLENIISALTFGVPLEIADEVLLYRNIKSILEGNGEEIEIYTNHPSFTAFFHKAYYELDIKEKVDSVAKVLNDIKIKQGVWSQDEILDYWKNFTKSILTLDTEFTLFSQNHKEILLNNSDEGMQNNIAIKLIKTLRLQIGSGNDIDQNKYYENLMEIEKFIAENNLSLNIDKLLTPIDFSVIPYLDSIYVLKNDYKKYKINCKEEAILKYLEDSTKEIDIESVYKNIDAIIIIKKEEKYKFERINSRIKNLLENVSYNEKDTIKRLLEVLKKLNEKSISLNLSSNFYTNITSSRLSEDEIYIDSLCIAISNFETAHSSSGNFQNTLRDLSTDNIDKVSKNIEWYFSFGELLKLLVTNSNAKNYNPLKAVAYKLVQNSYGTSNLSLDWVLKNYSKIISDIFNSDKLKEKEFLIRISAWHNYFITPVKNIDIQIFKHLDKQNLELIKKITVKTIEYYSNLNKENYFESFKNKSSYEYIFLYELLKNGLLTSFNNEFYSAYDDFLKGVSKGEISLPDHELWDDLIDVLNGNKLKSSFTSLRDYFAEHDDMSEDEISFFEKGLFKYGNLKIKTDDISLKFILPMIKSDNCFEIIFLNSIDNIIPLISESQHKESIVGELQIRYNSEKYKDNENMAIVSKEFGLNLENK